MAVHGNDVCKLAARVVVAVARRSAHQDGWNEGAQNLRAADRASAASTPAAAVKLHLDGNSMTYAIDRNSSEL